MNEVTIEHIKQACAWAKSTRDETEAKPINGQLRQYDQGEWDCNTSCCIWGAAHLAAGNGPATGPPPVEWANIDRQHSLLDRLMRSSTATPEMVGAIANNADLRGADLRGADLRGANLRGADLRGADLSGANLSDADLSDADLRRADLRGALVLVGNVNRKIACN